MNLEPVVYFADPSTLAVRLQLNTDDGWSLGEGIDLGGLGLEETVLSNETEDDEEVLSSRRPRSTMEIPLVLRKQTSVAAIISLMTALEVECDRAANAIVYQFVGTTTKKVYDTYRCAVPSLIRGQRLLTDCLKHDSEQLVLTPRRKARARDNLHF